MRPITVTAWVVVIVTWGATFLGMTLFHRLGIPISVARLVLLAYEWVVPIGIGIFAVAGLRAVDLGMGWRRLATATTFSVLALPLFIACCLLVVQLGGRVIGPHIAPFTVVGSFTFLLVFLSALAEEVLFRGFFLSSFAVLLHGRGVHLRRAIGVAIVAQAILFALSHIPEYLIMGASIRSIAFTMLVLVALGSAFALVYLWSGNLLLTAAVHAFWNFSGFPHLHPRVSRFIMVAVMLLLLLAYRQRTSAAASLDPT